MIKKTGTACIAIPIQTNVFIIFNFKIVLSLRQMLFRVNNNC